MSERYRRTESEAVQMPGAPADQNIRMKQKIIDFDEELGRLIVEEPTISYRPLSGRFDEGPSEGASTV